MKIELDGMSVGDSYPDKREISFEEDDDRVIIRLGSSYDQKISVDKSELKRVLGVLS